MRAVGRASCHANGWRLPPNPHPPYNRPLGAAENWLSDQQLLTRVFTSRAAAAVVIRPVTCLLPQVSHSTSCQTSSTWPTNAHLVLATRLGLEGHCCV
jgi:hypothetical protein